MQDFHPVPIQCHTWRCTRTLWNPTTHAVPRGGGAFDECAQYPGSGEGTGTGCCARGWEAICVDGDAPATSGVAGVATGALSSAMIYRFCRIPPQIPTMGDLTSKVKSFPPRVDFWNQPLAMAGNGFASMATIWMRCLSLFSALYSKAPPPPLSLIHGFPRIRSPFLAARSFRGTIRGDFHSDARQGEGSSLEAVRMCSSFGCGDQGAWWVPGRLGA